MQYRSVFRSSTSRFGRGGTPLDVEYDTSGSGRNADMAVAVLKSDVVYSAMRSTSSRFRPATAPGTSHLGPGYKFVNGKPGDKRVPNTVISKSSRFSMPRPTTAAAPYTVDTGIKATLAKQVETSSRKYGVMRSESDRFKVANVDPHLRHAMQRLSYTVDQGSAMTMTTAVAKSSRSYRSVMSSSCVRFRTGQGKDKHLVEAMSSLTYDVDAGPKASLATSVKGEWLRVMPALGRWCV